MQMQEKLVRTIIDYFPYPVASMFKILMTDECLDPGPLRLQYILKNAEAIARFLGIVSLMECRKLLEIQPDAKLSRALEAEFSPKLKRPSFGTWVHFAREGLRWLESQQQTPVIAGLQYFFYDEGSKETVAKKAMDHLVEVRNGLSHEKIRAFRRSDFADLCQDTYECLLSVLGNLAYFEDVSLGYVSSIEVSKKRNRDPYFLHRVKNLTGHSDDFEGSRPQFELYRESETVIMRYEDNENYLNLDPFLVYDAEVGKAPDLFFFSGYSSPRKVLYVGCKHGGNFSSDQCTRNEEIEEEIHHFLGLFNQQE